MHIENAVMISLMTMLFDEISHIFIYVWCCLSELILVLMKTALNFLATVIRTNYRNSILHSTLDFILNYN